MILLDSLPPDLRAEYALAYEARAVHDTATLRYTDYRALTGPAWVVATVVPKTGSGAATVPGAYIDPATGRFVSPAASAAVVVKEGVWRQVAAADRQAPRSASYSWGEPMQGRARGLATDSVYSPFAYGGTVVFVPMPDLQGLAYFGACRMIFPEWGDQAGEALRIAPQLLETTAPAPVAELTKAVTGTNGMLSTMALRTAMERGAPLASQAQVLFRAADSRRLSAFVYLSLVAPGTERSAWALELARLIDATQQPDRLLAIAYAAFAVSLFATQDAPARAAARQTLSQLHRRLIDLNMPVAADSVWFLIFKKSGVP